MIPIGNTTAREVVAAIDVLYTAQAHATGGRDGRVQTPDGVLDLQLRPPSELGGQGAVATNPEQLFAAGYSACFLSALKLMAGRERIRAGEFTVDSRVNLAKDEADGGFRLSVELYCELPGVEAEKATELVQAAHAGCPYSKATRGNIDVSLFAGGEPVAGHTTAGSHA